MPTLSKEQRKLAKKMMAGFKGRRTLFGVRQQYLGEGEFKLSGRDVRRVFHTLDTSGDGLLDHEEFATALARLGLGMRLDQSEELLRGLDSDGDASIGFSEFAEIVCLGQNLSREETVAVVATPPLVKSPIKRGRTRMRRMSATQRAQIFKIPAPAASGAAEHYPPQPHARHKHTYSAPELTRILREEKAARERKAERGERWKRNTRELQHGLELEWMRKRKPQNFVRLTADRTRMKELREWFQFMDLDGSGTVGAF